MAKVYVLNESYRTRNVEETQVNLGVFSTITKAKKAFEDAKKQIFSDWEINEEEDFDNGEYEIECETDRYFEFHDEDYETYYSLCVEEHEIDKHC